MAVYKEEFKFKLTKSIKYQNKKADGTGYEFAETSELILKAPCLRKHYRIGNILQALFTPALLKAQKDMLEITENVKNISKKEENKIEEKENKMDEKEANKVLFNFGLMALGKNINDFYDSFEDLLLSGRICFLNNRETELSSTEFNEIDYDDFKNLTVEYVVNFFIASWMKSLGVN